MSGCLVSHFEVASVQLDAIRKGHDAHLVRPAFVGVADGATPLRIGYDDAVRRFAVQALEVISATPEIYSEAGLGAVENVVRSALNEKRLVVDPNVSACMAWVWANSQELIAAVVGNCAVVVSQYGDDRCATVTDLRVEQFDREAVAAYLHTLSTTNDIEYAEGVMDKLLSENRRAMNKVNTYYLFDGSVDSIGRLEYETFRWADVDAILLATDGFMSCVDTFHLFGSTADLMRHLRERPERLDSVARRIRLLEDDDPRRSKFPRVSKQDDISAVLLRRSAKGTWPVL